MTRWKQLLRRHAEGSGLELRCLDDEKLSAEEGIVLEEWELETLERDWFMEMSLRVQRVEADPPRVLLEDPAQIWRDDWDAAEAFRQLAVKLREDGFVEKVDVLSDSTEDWMLCELLSSNAV